MAGTPVLSKIEKEYCWDIHAICDAAGILDSIVLLGKDIKSQAKSTDLHNIINNIPHFIFWKNRDSVFLGCNDAFAKSAGYASADEVIGKTDYDLPYTKEESDAYRMDDKEVMDNNRAKLNIEEPQTLQDGMTMTLLTNKVPLQDKAGNAFGVLGAYSDITEVKRQEEALAQIKSRVEGMTLVTASIAHEMRTPLAAIRGLVDGASTYFPTLIEAYQLARAHALNVPAIQEESVEMLTDSLQHIDRLVKQANMVIDMLLMNITAGGLKQVDLTTLSIKTSLKNALDIYPFSGDRRVVIQNNIEDDFLFMGHESLFTHVIFNLLKNALYFISKSRKGEILIWTETHDEHELHFKDTSMGIRSEDLPHIFDQFYTKNTRHGAGIGLAFCRSAITLQKGSISCRSEYGAYTEFIMRIPIVGHK